VNHCRALVLGDGAGIRKKIKKVYEKALRDLDNSRQQLERFHQTDLPQFTRWLNSHFGALLTELRELGQKIAADEQLVFQVESEVMFGGCSYAKAYRRVMEARENPEPPPRPAGGDSEPDRERETSGPNPGIGDAAAADEFFEEFFGGFGPEDSFYSSHGPRAERDRRPAAPAHTAARIKELYRALVRRLHPDGQREMTAQKTEWWHQAQAAYETGDAEQLEVILTLCEIGESGTTANTSASLLQRITAQLKSSLREIKRQLTERRRDPAWNFSRRADHEVLAIQMHRALTLDLQGAREHWREIQGLIAGWKRADEQARPRRRRQRQPQPSDCPF
jgi:hypothetical protein